MSFTADDRPRLVKRARLRFDELSRAYVLLSPERGLVLNDSAAQIVLRCRGEQTVEQIARQLAGNADAAQVLADTLELLSALRARRLIEADPSTR